MVVNQTLMFGPFNSENKLYNFFRSQEEDISHILEDGHIKLINKKRVAPDKKRLSPKDKKNINFT